MAIRDILRMGHPTLRARAEPVADAMIGTPDFQNLLTDLRDTLADSGGIGLAAPQIGVSLRVALIDLPGGDSRYGPLPRIPSTFFINPQITILNPATAGYWEGCLSVPGLRGFVERPQHLQVTARDEHGAPLNHQFEGFPATVIQHEFDHLDGRLYIDRLASPEQLMFEAEFAQFVLGEASAPQPD